MENQVVTAEPTHLPPTGSEPSHVGNVISVGKSNHQPNQPHTAGKHVGANGREEITVVVPDRKPMSSSGTVSWFDFVWIIGLAFLLTYIAKRLSRKFTSKLFKRWVPFIYAAIWTSSALLLAYRYAEGLPEEAWLGLLVIIVFVGLAAFLDEIRSIVAGIIMSFDHNIHIGDAIRIGEIEGKVTAFRMRFVRIEAPDGVVHDIPNTQFQKEVTSNFSEHGEHSRCLIQLTLPPGATPIDVIHAAEQACVLSPYASIYLKPQVLLSERIDSDRLQLNIYAFAFDQNVRETYRSDILKRLEKVLFAKEEKSELTLMTTNT